MHKVEVRCDLEGEPTVLGNLVQLLSFTSDLAPLDVREEDAVGITFSTMADGAYAENETNIVVGPICRSVTAEDGQMVSHSGKHVYRLLLVEVD